MRTQFALILIVAALMSTASCVNRNLGALNPCLVASFANQVTAGIKNLDLLFVIDNSGSMEQEQGKISAQIGALVNQLLTTTPLVDLHVGVVTTEGVWDDPLNPVAGVPPGSFGNESCAFSNSGNKRPGIMRTDVLDCRGADCVVDMPCDNTFVENNYFAIVDSGSQAQVDSFVGDVECAIGQGIFGCGTEQQLDAMYYALDQTGTGEENEGFLRDNALLAVILVTDEDDCSAPANSWVFDNRAFGGVNISVLDPAGTANDNPFRSIYPKTASSVIQQNQICAFLGDPETRAPGGLPDPLHPFNRFINVLSEAKHGDKNLVVFAAILGAPDDADLLSDHDALLAYRDDANCNAMNATCTTMSVEDSDNSSNTSLVMPACLQPFPSGDDTRAMPGRRLVRFTDQLSDAGAHTLLDTICASDYNDAVTEIGKLIKKVVGQECLPRDIPKNTQNLVNCRVVETLPVGVSCASIGNGRNPTPIATDNGHEVCLVEQLPTISSIPSGEGWYYDDFSGDASTCGGQRVAFTVGDEASDGAEVRFECFQTFAPDGDTAPADRGTQCDPNLANPCLFDETQPEQTDRLAELYNEAGLVLFCDDELSLTCQIDCDNDADCPGGFVCYDRDDPNLESGNEFCIIPTCTVGLIAE